VRAQQFRNIVIDGLLIRRRQLGLVSHPDGFDDRRQQPGRKRWRRMSVPFEVTRPMARRHQDCQLANVTRQSRSITQQFSDLLPFVRQLRTMK
jgi:hypothetical protein